MALYWGYHCKTCATSSARWTEDPRLLRRIFVEVDEKLRDLVTDTPAQTETCEVQPLFFLSRHYGHEIWIESDLATFALPAEQCDVATLTAALSSSSPV